MTPEHRIPGRPENASRIVAGTARQHGACSFCSGPVRGTRSLVTGTHEGRPYEALVCADCLASYVVPGPRRRSAAERDAFYRHIGAYRTACPMPAVPTAPTAREDWRAQNARLRRELDAVRAGAPRRTATAR
jgi:hypothetical protein